MKLTGQQIGEFTDFLRTSFSRAELTILVRTKLEINLESEVATDEGWRVVFGDADALNTKLANFAAIVELAHTQNLRLALVDLRPKDRPYYQLAP